MLNKKQWLDLEPDWSEIVFLDWKLACASGGVVVMARMSAARRRPPRYHVDTSEVAVRKSNTWCPKLSHSIPVRVKSDGRKRK